MIDRPIAPERDIEWVKSLLTEVQQGRRMPTQDSMTVSRFRGLPSRSPLHAISLLESSAATQFRSQLFAWLKRLSRVRISGLTTDGSPT